jgi:hypothetical protein
MGRITHESLVVETALAIGAPEVALQAAPGATAAETTGTSTQVTTHSASRHDRGLRAAGVHGLTK